MTVIVAARTKDDYIVMAGDRQVTAGWTKLTHELPKLWVSSDWIVGGSGSMRACQVVKHHVTWPRYRPDEDKDWERFAVTQLVPAVRYGVADTGIVKTMNGQESVGFHGLCAIKNRIVEVCTDYTAVADITGRAAVGSGYEIALGFLGTSGPWTEADVVEAVRRACAVSDGVGEPIDVVDTKTLSVRAVESSPNPIATERRTRKKSA